MLCAGVMQNGKVCIVNARYAVAATGVPLRPNGVYPNKLKLRSRHDMNTGRSVVEIQLFPDIVQDLEVHLQNGGIRCDLAEDFAGSFHQ